LIVSDYIPGGVNPVKFGQVPSRPGSPPMRIHCPTDGVPAESRTKSINQPAGQTPTFGGAVIVQVVPEHEAAGKSVRPPMMAPCVLEVAEVGWEDVN
jgi:hypothetical protein